MVRPSGEQLQFLLETSRIPTLICDVESVYYANAAFAREFGCESVAHALALHPGEDLVVPEQRERLRALLSGVLDSDRAWEMLSFRCLRRDGSVFNGLVRASSFRHENRPVAFVTVAGETGRREESGRLALLGQAVDTIDRAIIVAGPDLRTIYCNRAAVELMAVAADRLLGMDVRSLMSPKARDRELVMAAALEQEGRVSGEFLMRKPSGEEFPAHLTISVVRDAGGAEVARIGIVRDITGEKQMEEERELRERQLAVMLREAHHRIRDNLQLASDLLVLQSRGATAEVSEALAAAAERLRALGIVHQWISPDHDPPVVEVRHVIETVVRSLRETLTSGGDTIRFEVSVADCPIGSREATALALLTTELVTNAIRHGHPTTIGVRLLPEDGRWRLEVTDNGTGAPPPSDTEGTGGFGLQLVRLLAEEQLHGSFSLQRVGDTTAAWVTFPYATLPSV